MIRSAGIDEGDQWNGGLHYGRQRWSATVCFGCLRQSEVSVAPAATPAASPARNETWIVVQRGQTLDAVADRFRVPKAEIIALNDLKPTYRLKPGGILKLPFAANETRKHRRMRNQRHCRRHRRPLQPRQQPSLQHKRSGLPDQSRQRNQSLPHHR